MICLFFVVVQFHPGLHLQGSTVKFQFSTMLFDKDNLELEFTSFFFLNCLEFKCNGHQPCGEHSSGLKGNPGLTRFIKVEGEPWADQVHKG